MRLICEAIAPSETAAVVFINILLFISCISITLSDFGLGLLLKVIAPAICVDYGPFAFLAGFAFAVLHTQDALVSFFVNMFEDVSIIDFAGCRFFSAGVVAYVKYGYFLPGAVHIGDEVALGNLLMIQIIEDFTGWAVDRLCKSGRPAGFLKGTCRDGLSSYSTAR